MSQAAHILRQIPLFDDLPPAVLDDLQQIGHFYRLRPQEILFRRNDPARYLYIVCEGSLRLMDSTPTQNVSLRILGVHDLFAVAAIKPAESYPGQVEAIQESLVMGFVGAEFRHVMVKHPVLAVRVADWLITLLHQSHDRVRQMAAERVEQRLAKGVLFLGSKFGKRWQGEVRIDLPLARQDLADFTGTTVETVSRTLSQWEKQGIVRCGRRQVDILNEAALQAIAELLSLPEEA